MSKPEFNITDRAAEEGVAARDAQDVVPYALRIAVVGGGCSGYSYRFGWVDAARDDDNEFTNGGFRVLIDPKSMPYMTGSTLRWGESLMEYGFQIDNPNVHKACGCGSSFEV